MRCCYNKLECLNACVILMISECGGSQSVYNRPNEGTLINHDAAYILCYASYVHLKRNLRLTMKLLWLSQNIIILSL